MGFPDEIMSCLDEMMSCLDETMSCPNEMISCLDVSPNRFICCVVDHNNLDSLINSINIGTNLQYFELQPVALSQGMRSHLGQV